MSAPKLRKEGMEAMAKDINTKNACVGGNAGSVLRVIGIAGAGDSGKSHVLRWMIELLKARAVGAPDPTMVSMQPYDVREVVVYKKKRIAICTGGDTTDVIRDNITFFNTKIANGGLDIAVSAAKLFGRTHAALEAYAKPGKVEWYQKAYMCSGPITVDQFWKLEAEMIITAYL